MLRPGICGVPEARATSLHEGSQRAGAAKAKPNRSIRSARARFVMLFPEMESLHLMLQREPFRLAEIGGTPSFIGIAICSEILPYLPRPCNSPGRKRWDRALTGGLCGHEP